MKFEVEKSKVNVRNHKKGVVRGEVKKGNNGFKKKKKNIYIYINKNKKID